MENIKLVHFHSDMGHRTPSRSTPFNAVPDRQSVAIARSLGRCCVGDAEIICQDDKYIVVVMRVPNGIGANFYRDMYRIENA